MSIAIIGPTILLITADVFLWCFRAGGVSEAGGEVIRRTKSTIIRARSRGSRSGSESSNNSEASIRTHVIGMTASRAEGKAANESAILDEPSKKRPVHGSHESHSTAMDYGNQPDVVYLGRAIS